MLSHDIVRFEGLRHRGEKRAIIWKMFYYMQQDEYAVVFKYATLLSPPMQGASSHMWLNAGAFAQ
jgi:hypothetical protein